MADVRDALGDHPGVPGLHPGLAVSGALRVLGERAGEPLLAGGYGIGPADCIDVTAVPTFWQASPMAVKLSGSVFPASPRAVVSFRSAFPPPLVSHAAIAEAADEVLAAAGRADDDAGFPETGVKEGAG